MNYIFFANGFETVEGLAVVDMLRRVGIPITTVSMNEDAKVTTSHKIDIMCDMLFLNNGSVADFSDADFLIIPGGLPGTDNLEANGELCKLLKSHAMSGKNVAAICAAPRILGGLGLLEGKRACCYPGYEDRLLGAKVSTNEVEADGNVITSRGMGTVIEFSKAIISSISGADKAKEIADKIIYRQ